MAGAPGSKWSSVAKNIYYSPDIDRSDDNIDRVYASSVAYNGSPMHVGSYFDPGMEFGKNFDCLDQLTVTECEAEFDRPFSGAGIKIIKSHVFMHYIDFLKTNWPDCPIVLVHRGDDACLGWWIRCGGFDITYPDYRPYYKDIETMYQHIIKQNSDMRPFWDFASFVNNNHELCRQLGIEIPDTNSQQVYVDHKIRVKVY
jgi:hypothetical protein